MIGHLRVAITASPSREFRTMITLRNVTAAPRPPSPSTLREGRPGRPQRAGNRTLFALLNGTLHEDGGDYSIPSQWRMGQGGDMPETEQSATDVMTATPPARRPQRSGDAEASDDGMRMAEAHGDCTTPASTTPKPAPRR